MGFKQILTGSIGRPAPSKPQKVKSQTPMIDPLARLAPTPNIEKNEGAQKIGAFLDIIESYIQKLEDHNFTLKDLAPIIDQMAHENDVVADLLDSLPESDGLKPIANEALIISSLEVTKFNRGDYLDSYLERG